jgi:hypothetical protein
MDQFNVERQADDFPLGVSGLHKKWACNRVQEILKVRNGLRLYEIVDLFFNSIDLPNEFKNAIMQDWRYALVERACRKVAEQVWILK